jgi:hypothetical protein
MVDLGGPGFYQERLRGRKSGRLSPRTAVRGAQRERVYAAHGLIDQGAADPLQGQLFDPSPITMTPQEAAAGRNITPGVVSVRSAKGTGPDLPLAGAPGFMPGLTAKQKVQAIRSMGEITESETPVKDLMQKRAALSDAGSNQPWYSGVDPETGEHDISIVGDSPEAIAASAHKMGVSRQAMTRAVATTSARNQWLAGNPGLGNVSMPNIESGEGAIDVAKSLPSSASEAELKSASIAASGRGLPAMTLKAVKQYRSSKEDVTQPIRAASRISQKVPNFEHSLKLSGSSPLEQRIAADSWTVDTHDLKSLDLPENALDKVGNYELIGMTGARSAFKRGQLPPNEQARIWMAQKARTEKTPLGPLFVEDKGHILSNPQFSASED